MCWVSSSTWACRPVSDSFSPIDGAAQLSSPPQAAALARAAPAASAPPGPARARRAQPGAARAPGPFGGAPEVALAGGSRAAGVRGRELGQPRRPAARPAGRRRTSSSAAAPRTRTLPARAPGAAGAAGSAGRAPGPPPAAPARRVLRLALRSRCSRHRCRRAVALLLPNLRVGGGGGRQRLARGLTEPVFI